VFRNGNLRKPGFTPYFGPHVCNEYYPRNWLQTSYVSRWHLYATDGLASLFSEKDVFLPHSGKSFRFALIFLSLPQRSQDCVIVSDEYYTDSSVDLFNRTSVPYAREILNFSPILHLQTGQALMELETLETTRLFQPVLIATARGAAAQYLPGGIVPELHVPDSETSCPITGPPLLQNATLVIRVNSAIRNQTCTSTGTHRFPSF
jgi:hypothetical protein